MPKNYLTDDVRILDVRPLVPPAILAEEIPASLAVQSFVRQTRDAITAILEGEDPRLLVVVGPCSIHDVDQAKDYARQLKVEADRHADQLLIVMRTYFEKPRTVAGWKGLMNDPDLDESFRINKGLRLARQLMSDLNEIGVPCGCEFLDNILPQYVADLVSWVAVGARTSESQIHREFASGCSMPVGFKNATSGRVETAIDAVRAARVSHWFPSVTKQGVSAILQTSGNESCHVVLRGGNESGPNYQESVVRDVCHRLDSLGLPARVMVDCSHGNSGKDHTKQPGVARDCADQIARGGQGIMGLMLESNLRPGRQDYVPGQPAEYGVSITDACLGFEETATLLDELARAVTGQSLSRP